MSNQYLKLRRSAVPGKVPTTSSLEFGEIALNTYDGLAFMKRSASYGEEVVAIGSNAGLNGVPFFAAVFNTPTSVYTGSIYDSGSFTAVGATTPVDPNNPERLFVDAGNTTSYNAISAHGEIDNYLQLNVQNFSYGATASSDLVATANNGDQFSNYIDVGINNAGYNYQTGIGTSNDAYIYSTGNDLYIGNASDGKKVILFNGSGNGLDHARLFITDQGTVGINAIDASTSNPEALLVEPLVSSPFDFNNLIIGRGKVEENYVQVNIINLGSGSLASADVVATNDIGDENSYYIDMGINSSGYSTPNLVGGPNDAYVYSTGEHLHFGNASNYPVTIFAGGIDSFANQKLYIDPNNQHQLTGSLEIRDSLTVQQGVTASLFGTASWALNALTASYAMNAGGSTIQFMIATGSVTASVSEQDSSIFLIQSSSVSLFSVDNTGSLTLSGSINLETQGSFNALASIKNNGTEYVKVNGEGVLVLHEYSSPPSAVAGGIYFDTVGELFVGV